MKKWHLLLTLFILSPTAYSQMQQVLVDRVDDYYEANASRFKKENTDSIGRANNDWGMDNKSQSEFSTFLENTIDWDEKTISEKRNKAEVDYGHTTHTYDKDGNITSSTFHRNTKKGDEAEAAEKDVQRAKDKNDLKTEVETKRAQKLAQYNQERKPLIEAGKKLDQVQAGALESAGKASKLTAEELAAQKTKAQNIMATNSNAWKTQSKEVREAGAQNLRNATILNGSLTEKEVHKKLLDKDKMQSSMEELNNTVSFKTHDLNKDGKIDTTEAHAQLLARPSIKATTKAIEKAPIEYSETAIATKDAQGQSLSREEFLETTKNSLKRTNTLQNFGSAYNNLQTSNQTWQTEKAAGVQLRQALTLVASEPKRGEVLSQREIKNEQTSTLPELSNRRSFKRNDTNKDGILDDTEIREQLLKRPSIGKAVENNEGPEEYQRLERGTINRENFAKAEMLRKEISDTSLEALKNRPSYKRALKKQEEESAKSKTNQSEESDQIVRILPYPETDERVNILPVQ